ncbi:hypothetical protein Fmac_032595 [Flemingia macrophylla]|uniref:Uncharacterized protein n=1 Tax=Flemingia macrophylla TaxID=520843 RepID=A0ABD1L5E4_9FABA
MRELEVVMPQTEIPEWFDFIGNGENPCFWVRGKVPALALALVFQDVMGWGREGRHQILQLQLVINGRCVSRKGYKFRIAEGHVLICDPRILFSEEEWLGLDALLEHDDWNVVNVSYQAPPPLILSQWGVYVYEEGANMKDVQFVCPDSKYLDMPPTAIVPTEEDPKQERKRLIENFCMDEVLEASVLEYMKVFEKHKVQKDMEEVYSKIAFWKKVSKQAKDELKSEGSDLEDKHSLLTTFLKNSYASTHEIFHDEIDDLPQQKEIMRKIFSDGVRDGLLETLAKFPSLNIFKAKSVALRKGNKVRWYYDKMPGVVKQYVGGIISGVLEAKLHFPDLKTSEILAPTYRMVGRNYAHDNLFRPPLVRFINEVKVDLGQQALSRYAYYDGVTDGLYEAQNSFPYLDIIETRNVAINKMGFWSVLDDEFVRLIRTFETMESYIQGVLGGLIEAKRSFPDLNIKKTLSRVLLRMVNFNVSTVEDVPDNFLGKDFTLLEELKDEEKESMDIIREASSSTYGHQGSEEEQGNDPQQEKTLREIFFEGITDALVQARINFPFLDINKTRSAALNANIYGHRAVWSLPEEGGGNPHLPIAKKIYIEGVVNGLLEAKLSFPNLNISETLNTLRSRKLKTSFVTELDWNKVIHPPPGSHDPPFSKLEGESKFPFNLVEDKLLEYKDVAPNVDIDPGTSSGKNQYDESIQEFNTQSDEFVSTKLDCASGTRILTDNGCKCETKYGKVSTVLKGRDEELGKLYHDRIESFQKSEEFHDLMIATYLNGLRDGLVEAQAILLAQDVGTNSGD